MIINRGSLRPLFCAKGGVRSFCWLSGFWLKRSFCLGGLFATTCGIIFLVYLFIYLFLMLAYGQKTFDECSSMTWSFWIFAVCFAFYWLGINLNYLVFLWIFCAWVHAVFLLCCLWSSMKTFGICTIQRHIMHCSSYLWSMYGLLCLLKTMPKGEFIGFSC